MTSSETSNISKRTGLQGLCVCRINARYVTVPSTKCNLFVPQYYKIFITCSSKLKALVTCLYANFLFICNDTVVSSNTAAVATGSHSHMVALTSRCSVFFSSHLVQQLLCHVKFHINYSFSSTYIQELQHYNLYRCFCV